MEEDDDRVRRLPRDAHLLEQAWDVLRRREPGLAGSRRPGGDQLVVEHLRRADHGDPLPVDRAAERAVRLLRVEPDPDDREAVALCGGERVAESRRRRSRGRGCSPSTRRRRLPPRSAANAFAGARNTKCLRRRGAAARHCGLQVHDREVGRRKHGLDRVEDVRRDSTASFDSSTPSKWTSPPNARTTGRALGTSSLAAGLDGRADEDNGRGEAATDEGESELCDSWHERRPGGERVPTPR